MQPTPYDASFYSRNEAASTRSAAVVVPLLKDILAPRSVIDVGCGLGIWLRAWIDEGVEDVRGVDGEHVDRARLRIPEDRFTPHDLCTPYRDTRRYDLAMSLEVAEHLPAEAADTFVASLCALANVVVFSGAAPGQGGTDHVNEQRASYWVRKFAERGYECLDALRPRIWDEEDVAAYYRQNTLVFLGPDADRPASPPLPPLLDVVHPRILEKKAAALQALEDGMARAMTSPRAALRNLRRALGAWLRRGS